MGWKRGEEVGGRLGRRGDLPLTHSFDLPPGEKRTLRDSLGWKDVWILMEERRDCWKQRSIPPLIFIVLAKKKSTALPSASRLHVLDIEMSRNPNEFVDLLLLKCSRVHVVNISAAKHQSREREARGGGKSS